MATTRQLKAAEQVRTDLLGRVEALEAAVEELRKAMAPRKAAAKPAEK